MNAKILNIKIFETSIVVFVFSFLFFTFSSAQQAPELIVTWKSNNYTPPGYQGRALPIDGSRIDMALELIDQGRVANLSGKEIRWLINDDELKSGVGLKNISFIANGFRGDQEVEVTIMDYSGANLEKLITIPTVRPEIVITGGPITFKALPYFFNIQNISQLRFNWSANGIRATGAVDNPSVLQLQTPGSSGDYEIGLKVTTQNISRPLEIASKTIKVVK